jgi:FkbM family methyltransferase
MMGIAKPTYLDIGAHDPVWLSNTYLFYRLGCRGVCVEPSPQSHRAIKRIRPRDICLQCGVGAEANNAAAFYVMDPPTLSSFSKEFIDANVGCPSYRLKEIITIPLLTTSAIIDSHFPTSPNFVSLDVEGHDEQIMKAWDFNRYRPEVFCVETLSHHDSEKVLTITPAFLNAGYVVFADTYINTIYVDATVLEGLRSRG